MYWLGQEVRAIVGFDPVAGAQDVDDRVLRCAAHSGEGREGRGGGARARRAVFVWRLMGSVVLVLIRAATQGAQHVDFLSGGYFFHKE